MKKRILCLLLAAVFIVVMIPAAFAEEADFTITNGESINLSGSANGYNLSCYWQASDPSVISFVQTGTSTSSINNYIYLTSNVTVTGLKPGTSTLSFIDSNGRVRASSVIEVMPNECDLNGHKVSVTVAKEPTCTEDGNSEYYTCSVCGKHFSDKAATNEIKKNSWIIKATGHKLVKTEARAVTCTEDGNTEYYTCSACGRYFSDANGKKEIEKNSWILKSDGHHLTKTESCEATCTEDGNSEYYTCSVCGRYFSDANGKKEIEKDSWVIKATGHDISKMDAKKATCTEAGNKECYACSACGKYFSDADGNNELKKEQCILPALGHSFSDWSIIKEPTETEGGLKERTCATCMKKETEVIPSLSHAQHCPSSKFKDVEIDVNHWSHLPIDYVVEKGYMAGVSPTSFVPEGSVSRAMVVQVIYAMEGKPDVSKSAGFDDVKAGEWYADAVNWAAEKGIVAGYTNGCFGVDDAVLRQDLVAILYKYAVFKNYDSATAGDLTIFADRNSISKYAVNGMKWGVSHGIISGIPAGSKINAEPKSTATRAQLAVVLKAFDINVKIPEE